MKVSQKFREMTDERLLEVIKEGLSSSPAWAERGLLALYSLQTEAEKANPNTVHESNGRGFSPVDQIFLSDLARQALRDVDFSDRQMDWLYKLLPKYGKQLLSLIRETQMKEERASEDFVATFYMSQLSVLTDKAKIEATTGELELSPEAMPQKIRLTNPSGTEVHEFTFSHQHNHLFIYGGQLYGRSWTLLIEIAEEEEAPQWAVELERAAKMKGRPF